jgi:aliphatic nitrilase
MACRKEKHVAGDTLGTVRAAVVQAESCFLDRAATVDKTIGLIESAARAGAEIVVFPEGFIPTHPLWFHFHAATSKESLEMAADLFRNAVVLDGPDVKKIAAAVKRAGVWATIGVCEKRADTTGTLWNSAVHFAPDGTIAGVHRKLTPTVGERLVHTGGGSEGLEAPHASFGKVSSLICAENSNPLLIFSAAAQYPVIHTALWPNHFSPTQPRMRDVMLNASRAIAYQGGCYVLSSAGTIVSDETARRIARDTDDLAWIRDPQNVGGSCIVAPSGDILAGPAGGEEAILTADLDLDVLVRKQILHDFAGHYNRADLLGMVIRPSVEPIFQAPWSQPDAGVVHGDEQPAVSGEPDQPALGEPDSLRALPR